MKDTFSSYHPVVNMLYFAVVLIFAMFLTHPVCLVISFVCAFVYSVYLNGKKALKFNVVFILPMLIVTALLNPLFNHQGMTILAYLPDGNPLTFESIIYGVIAALMLIAVISWFSCFNKVMTSDKFAYLFGRIIPALSLILSMSLRLVPRFQAQIKNISNAQKCIGRNITNGNILRKAKNGIKILSIMVTWALENAIETADSMKSRGYGLPKRTTFSIFRFQKRDFYALIYIFLCGGYIFAGLLTEGLYFRYFPSIGGSLTGTYAYTLILAYFALCIMPVIINIQEDRKWAALQSKI